MTRRIRGLCIGCGALVALGLFSGCAQTQDRAGGQSPQAAVAQAAATTVSNAVSTAAGSNADTTRPAQRRASTGIKRNGRGGYDVSEQQKAALRRAHAIRDRYGVIDRSPRPTTRPASR